MPASGMSFTVNVHVASFLDANRSSPRQNRIDLAAIRRGVAQDTCTGISEEPVGAAASAGTIIALDLKALTQRAEVIVLGRCLESSVRWNAERRQIACPCHAGFFDVNGRVVSGPPPRPLSEYGVVIVNGEVMVKSA